MPTASLGWDPAATEGLRVPTFLLCESSLSVLTSSSLLYPFLEGRWDKNPRKRTDCLNWALMTDRRNNPTHVLFTEPTSLLVLLAKAQVTWCQLTHGKA